MDYVKLTESCHQKSQIDEQRMNGLEYALKQVMAENEKLRKERKTREDQESHESK